MPRSSRAESRGPGTACRPPAGRRGDTRRDTTRTSFSAAFHTPRTRRPGRRRSRPRRRRRCVCNSWADTMLAGPVPAFILPWIAHYGIAAIFVLLLLGVFGLPVPDETLLTFAGVLVRRGELHLLPPLPAGVLRPAGPEQTPPALGRRPRPRGEPPSSPHHLPAGAWHKLRHH